MTALKKRSLAGVSAVICGTLVCLVSSLSAGAQSLSMSSARMSQRHVTPRQQIKERLDRIVIPVVAFEDVPLPDVIKFIQAEIARNDPGGKTLNFMLNSYLVEQSPAPVPLASTDPAQPPTVPPPLPTPAVPPTDLDTVLIRINPPLHDLKLAHVLDAVMKSASSPIRFTIEDYAVVFFRSSPEAVGLASRQVRVNPNTFQQGLQGVTAKPIFNLSAGQGGQNSSSGGATISTVTAAPGGGSGGISGVTTPATR